MACARRARRLVQAREVLRLAHHVHAAAAAAGHRLDDHRVADRVGDLLRLLGGLDRLDRPGQQRQAGLLHQVTGDRLVADPLHHLRLGADEGDVVVGADLGEERVLGEEAVAGVDGLGAGLLRRADDVRDVEVALAGRRRPDADRLVGEPDDRGLRVGGRVDGHRLDAQLAAGARHAQGDLAAVGDQDLLEHAGYSPTGSRYISTCSNSTGSPFSTTISATLPPSPAATSFISFIASTMHTVWPISTTSPTSANAFAPG